MAANKTNKAKYDPLHSIKSIVKEHGGLLEFTSVPGEGTTFIVKIPAVEPAPQEQS